MNANTKSGHILIHTLTALILLTALGCAGKKPLVVVYMPERIIRDYSEMRENEIVAWAWVRRGFALKNCRSIDFQPIIDASQTPHPAIVGRIEQDLQNGLKDRTDDKAELVVALQAAVVEVKDKPGWIKKWFIDFDGFPYVEVELLITDRGTGLPLVRIVHYARDQKSLNTAVSHLTADLVLFLKTAL